MLFECNDTFLWLTNCIQVPQVFSFTFSISISYLTNSNLAGWRKKEKLEESLPQQKSINGTRLLDYMSHGKENLNNGETIYRINRMNYAKLLLLYFNKVYAFIIFFQNYERSRKIQDFFYKSKDKQRLLWINKFELALTNKEN